MTKDTTF